ncbi:MAG: ROK family protein [Chitinophagaceae bacterium]|nr:ROK family protein [Chitinophagaceae bacterium]
MQTYIGIDLGGTRIKGVAIDANRKILHQLYTPTNDGDDLVWKSAILRTVTELKSITKDSKPFIGISAPGITNESNTAIACMPGRLQGLEEFNWTDYLGHSTLVINDAIAALLAEARLGAAKDKENVALLTLGTGVGGAILIDGKPYQGSFHKAGHIGHMVIDSEGTPDVTGMPGSLEDAIGNCTIERRSNGRFSQTHELLEAMRKGDQEAKMIWLLSVRKLAIGLASVSNVLSPELFVLGGGITEAGDDLFNPLREYLEIYDWRPNGNRAQVVKAVFGDMAGAVGAACYAIESNLK